MIRKLSFFLSIFLVASCSLQPSVSTMPVLATTITPLPSQTRTPFDFPPTWTPEPSFTPEPIKPSKEVVLPPTPTGLASGDRNIVGVGNQTSETFGITSKRITITWKYLGGTNEQTNLDWAKAEHDRQVSWYRSLHAAMINLLNSYIQDALDHQDAFAVLHWQTMLKNEQDQMNSEIAAVDEWYKNYVNSVTTSINVKLKKREDGKFSQTLIAWSGVGGGTFTWPTTASEDYYFEVVAGGAWSITIKE